MRWRCVPRAWDQKQAHRCAPKERAVGGVRVEERHVGLVGRVDGEELEITALRDIAEISPRSRRDVSRWSNGRTIRMYCTHARAPARAGPPRRRGTRYIAAQRTAAAGPAAAPARRYVEMRAETFAEVAFWETRSSEAHERHNNNNNNNNVNNNNTLNGPGIGRTPRARPS